MRELVAVAMLLGGLCLFGPVAMAQASPTRDCSDDSGVDRCAGEQQQRVRELFGVPPIEELQAGGSQVRRAFYVDGYGRDLIALTFIRAPGSDPRVMVHFPRNEGAPAPAPIGALVPPAVWQSAITRGRHFDRTLAPRPDHPGDGSLSICLHSWVVTVEASNPVAERGNAATVRGVVEDACASGLAVDYAFELAGLAIPLFPFCAALDPDQHRNDVSRLAACALLDGDRLAAADALNKATLLRRVREAGDAPLARGVFDYRAVLDWSGTETGGGGRAFLAWVAQTTGTSRANFYVSRAVGESGNRVRVEGSLWRSARQPDGAGEVRLQAPVTLIFTSSPNDPGLKIERATVGAFAAAAD